jgi:hypothetical protein
MAEGQRDGLGRLSEKSRQISFETGCPGSTGNLILVQSESWFSSLELSDGQRLFEYKNYPGQFGRILGQFQGDRRRKSLRTNDLDKTAATPLGAVLVQAVVAALGLAKSL